MTYKVVFSLVPTGGIVSLHMEGETSQEVAGHIWPQLVKEEYAHVVDSRSDKTLLVRSVNVGMVSVEIAK